MKNKISFSPFYIFMGLLGAFGPQTLQAQQGFTDFGMRGGVELGDGIPANDIISYGIYTHYQFSNGFLLGLALDISGYDFEGPAQIVGVTQNLSLKTIDASAQATNITAWYEQRGASWYWRAGLGVGIVDVDDVSGPVQGGGTFNIKTDASTEYLLLGGVGYRYKFNQNWGLDSYFGLNHHIADWKVRDTVSGRTGTVGGYTDYSIQLGIDYSF